MKPIYINFKPSKILSTLLICAGLLAISMTFLVELSYAVQSVLLVLIVICTIYSVISKALLIVPWSFVALRISTKNIWQLRCSDGDSVEIVLTKNSVVTPYLTILNFKIHQVDNAIGKNRRRLQNYLMCNSVIILPDSIDEKRYRQLRVRLRWGQLTALN